MTVRSESPRGISLQNWFEKTGLHNKPQSWFFTKKHWVYF
jgi:hypothetical protein